MRTRTLDNDTMASDPGGVRLSSEKLKRIQPELDSTGRWLMFLATHPAFLFGAADRGFWRIHIAEHLMYGDSTSAVVISINPLLIAAHTDELDCVAMLKFENSLVRDYNLAVGSRLITVNTYSDLENGYEEDLFAGKNAYGRYGNFSPFIADFLTEDYDVLENRKKEIEESQWLKTETLGDKYLSAPDVKARDGRPLFCAMPASLSVKR